MNTLREIRGQRGLSQRNLARQAGVSFRALQMIETGQTDVRWSSLVKIASALGTPAEVMQAEFDRLLADDPDSVVAVSRKILADGETSWKLWLFEFVDAFRRSPRQNLVIVPPSPETGARILGLLASSVETLCAECGAGIENLKVTALVESSAYFRKRNIFVMANFLTRA